MENEINKVIKRRTRLYQIQEINIIKRTKEKLKEELNLILNKYSDNTEEEEIIFKLMKKILEEGF